MFKTKMFKPISPKRNAEIDFWKFISIAVVVLHHSNLVLDERRVFFKQGSLFVEFFFIVSGYLMALTASKLPKANIETLGGETVKFILKKIRAVLPTYIFSLVIIGTANIIRNGPEYITSARILKFPFAVLFLEMTGIPVYNISGSAWYLSAMFLSMFALYPILRSCRDLFMKVISPLVSVFIYGYFMRTDGFIGDPKNWFDFGCKGLWRGVAGICLGCAAFACSEWLKTKYMYKGLPTLLSIASTGSMVLAVIFGYIHIDSKVQTIYVLLFFIAVVIMTSRVAPINKIYQNSFCAYLGKLSMAVYLCHPVCSRIMNFASETFETAKLIKYSTYGDEIFAAAFFIGGIMSGIVCIWITEPIEKKISLMLKNAREKGEKEKAEIKE